MVVDAVRAYLDAVNGLTELTRKRAVAAAKVILKAGEERPAASAPSGTRTAGSAGESGDGAQRAGSPIQTLAGELIETSQANREALNALVSSEVERALERLELVSRADYDRLARRVAELERRLAAQRPLIRTAPVH
ncbi:membrane fusogenic activity family protein, partial [Streptomonospora algeriensis]